ncbi:MAG: RHS repeat-associated core domain-containing protein [Verrucomicrobia bacterium]|nr:RHS repeat-associated core domain-containing protein [Verrucomicrobiota bacterium]
MTNDGRFAYTWDGENRLIDMTSLATDPDGSKVKLDFAYDAQGRRIGKIVSTWNGSAYVPESTNIFLYDGWNLVAELNPDGSVIRSYVWGDDLSGSQQGAGGIGGLLEVSYHGTQTTNCFVAFDGNGNVAALVNAADGTVAANYEYGPFGEVIRSTGPMAKANPIRWSTKYQDDESDLIMYPYRPYKPSTGTWLSQDPKMEPGFELVFRHNSRSSPNDFIDDYGNFNKGDLNAYAFVKNGPLQYSDPLGLDSEPDVSWAPAPCPFGEKSIFIQTLYGGWGPYKGPRVDDGGAGFFGGGSKGCPDYPSFGMPGVFQDSPSGVLTGPVHFITCRVCLKKCGCDEWRIASIGPCIYWKKGDKGDLSGSGFTQVSGPPQTWEDALDQDYPTVAHGLCYKCLGNK